MDVAVTVLGQLAVLVPGLLVGSLPVPLFPPGGRPGRCLRACLGKPGTQAGLPPLACSREGTGECLSTLASEWGICRRWDAWPHTR